MGGNGLGGGGKTVKLLLEFNLRCQKKEWKTERLLRNEKEKRNKVAQTLGENEGGGGEEEAEEEKIIL